MNYNNTFVKAIVGKQLDQGRNAQFAMMFKARKLMLPVDIQCTLFESLVFPFYYMVVKSGGSIAQICWRYCIESF